MRKALPGSRKTLSACPAIEREEAGRRFAWMLAHIYRDNVAKRFERDFNVSPATAEKIAAGKLPENATLIAACRRFGRAFMEFVIAGPADWERTAQAEAQIAALQVQLDLLKRRQEEP